MKKLLTFGLASLVLFSGISTAKAEENTTSDNAKVNITSEQLTKQEKLILKAQSDELREIWDQHPVEEGLVEEPTVSPSGIGVPAGTIGLYGDILLALDSITDHVAIVKDSYLVIEAHPDTDNVAYRENNYPARYNDIKGLRVKTTSATKSKAVTYAEGQLGEPYSLFSTRNSTNSWYCSKLVWAAYYYNGLDLESTFTAGMITPGDLLESPHTSVFYSSR